MPAAHQQEQQPTQTRELTRPRRSGIRGPVIDESKIAAHSDSARRDRTNFMGPGSTGGKTNGYASDLRRLGGVLGPGTGCGRPDSLRKVVVAERPTVRLGNASGVHPQWNGHGR